MADISLPAQFHPSDKWAEAWFKCPHTGHNIRYCHSLDEGADKTLIILPGLSEFAEKYIETAQYLNNHGFSVYIIDWAYQGKSTRYSKNRDMRHSDGFDADVADLHFLINDIISPNNSLYLLGHSMGAHLGLRFLVQYPGIIKAASFSAPMLGIHDLKYYAPIAKFLAWLSSSIKTCYVPGGRDWHATARRSDGTDVFSSDPLRDNLHNAWCLHDPELQVGNPTMKWLYDALHSIQHIRKKEVVSQINIPVYIGVAEAEKIVDNHTILKTIQHISQCAHDIFPNAKHEILMETDQIRSAFLQKTLNVFLQS